MTLTRSTILSEPAPERMLSLDFFRGLTMFLLIAEFTHLFSYMTDPSLAGSIVHFIGEQFHHHPWNGLRFWDLVQPFFMFIVGVAIPLSIDKRMKQGQKHTRLIRHAITRSILLLLMGWGLYCISAGKIVFRFQNVLAQLSVTYLITFLLIRKSVTTQLLVSFALLALTEIIYRSFPIDGFNQAFVPNHNFGTWFDQLYGGENLKGYWVSFNAIPTTAHTIWGALAGKLLISDRNGHQKLKILIIAGVAGLVIGYGLGYITPIIKRISTSSFVIVSGGWTILALAFSYWLIDLKKKTRLAWFFAIVGMNPLFIYLFAHVGGADFIESIIHPFSMGLFGWMGELTAQVLTSIIVLFLLWYICYWLYKKKIYIRI
ncbi:acyltransferase family protein [Bacteroidota bacterium]